MRGNYGTLHLNEKDRANIWKAHMSKSMPEENEWEKFQMQILHRDKLKE